MANGCATNGGRDRGYGPQQAWHALPDIVDGLADVQPDAPALQDAGGVLTYAQLRDNSRSWMAWLCERGLHKFAEAAPQWESTPLAPRAVVFMLPRSCDFFVLFVACARLGLPVMVLCCDTPDEAVEAQRNAQSLKDVTPLAVIGDVGLTRAALEAAGRQDLENVLDIIDMNELKAPATPESLARAREIQRKLPTSPASALCYVYTGGTTKASKCVTVTHAMALWEAEQYSTAMEGLSGRGDKFLQYSTLFWGAAVFGQLSSGWAVGGCVCIGGDPRPARGSASRKAADALQQLVTDVTYYEITVLGVVPSQLRGAWPDGPSSAPRCVRVLIVWADKCPVDLARAWRNSGIKVVDLLIASEYWLALFSHCQVYSDGDGGGERHVYRALPSLDARFLVEDDDVPGGLRDAKVGEVGEMHLYGPTVSPGYISPVGTVDLDVFDAVRCFEGKRYLRTRDKLLLLPHGGLVYSGRADNLLKHAGKWVDADALQDAVLAVPDVINAAVLPGPNGIDAFVVLRQADLGDAAKNGEALTTEDWGDSTTDDSSKNGRHAAHPKDAPSCPAAKRQCMRKAGGWAAPPFKTLAAVRRILPNSRIHVCTEIPLNPHTAKIDRKALQRRLEEMEDCRHSYQQEQERSERAHVRAYSAWLALALVLVSGPQAVVVFAKILRTVLRGQWFAAGNVKDDMAALLGASTAAHPILAVLRFGGVGVSRFALAPVLWLAATYFGMRHDTKWQFLPLQFLRRRANLPEDAARWLPLLSAALLPLGCLPSWTVCALAFSYLGWARERDVSLSLGFGAVGVSTLMTAVVGSRESLGVGLLGIFTAALSPRSRDFAKFLLAAPGLYYQVLPRMLNEDYGWLLPNVEPVDESGSRTLWQRLMLRMRLPKFPKDFMWSEKTAVVDEGNYWNLVNLEGDKQRSPWNSIGLIIKLVETDSTAALLSLPSQTNGTAVIQNSGNGCKAMDVEHNDLAGVIGAIVEQVSGVSGDDALHGIDSMQAIQITEAVRREFHKPLRVVQVIGCSELSELVLLVESMEEQQQPQDAAQHVALPSLVNGGYRRIWLCGLGPRSCSVDWLISREQGQPHIDVQALQRAVYRLVERHAALRAKNWAEQAMFDATYSAASLWQLWSCTNPGWTNSFFGKLLSASIFESWPRSHVLPVSSPEAKVTLVKPTIAQLRAIDEWQPKTTDERAYWTAGELLRQCKPEEMFKVCVVPIFDISDKVAPEVDACALASTLEPWEVQWFFYAVLDHGYCDGPTGLPLSADLLRLYAEEIGQAGPPPVAPDALKTLEGRLLQSLKPLPEAAHPNDDIFHDGLCGWAYRRGYTRFLRFDQPLMKLMRHASREVLGCSIDVAWLTAIAAAFLRMFPEKRRLDFFLVVTCRDHPTEEQMVGYLSSRKLMPLEVGDSSKLALLGLADMISAARRQRTWRRPRPFEKGNAIEVNIVSQAADGLPMGFQEVRCKRNAPREWERGTTALMNLRLDQVARDDWDFRLQSHDASWGGDWSSYYAQALGSVLVDMALRPTSAVVPKSGADY
eukprot:TRINITY_DN4826_c0_g2_i4.p1 TRINITY_DN4826_c0_g2~~TRINITY_DN4826_c0_g2_i4.p1  ORF type:complete len:1533 (-),score=336.30 TRINITY_DN4826_c0_g2_i4:810-5408(-)